MTGSETAIAVGVGILLGLQLVKEGVALVRRRNGNGKNGKAGKSSFDPAACADREARIWVLESRHGSGDGFDINLCRKHGEGMARLEVGARTQWKSFDRRLVDFSRGIGALSDDVKELTKEVAQIPKNP